MKPVVKIVQFCLAPPGEIENLVAMVGCTLDGVKLPLVVLTREPDGSLYARMPRAVSFCGVLIPLIGFASVMDVTDERITMDVLHELDRVVLERADAEGIPRFVAPKLSQREGARYAGES